MSEPFIGEIIIFAGNFPIRGFAYCDGQLLPISQNTALFSLLGTTFGGDGRTTFALPDLKGRIPMHPGTGPGLTNRRLGEETGATTVTLSAAQLGAHSHAAQVAQEDASSTSPTGNALGIADDQVYRNTGALVAMGAQAVGQTGGSGGAAAPHDNMQPYLALTFQIALTGVYPSRS